MEKEKLLLHSCCAPCSVYVMELLLENYQVTSYFYNPNIHFYNEYQKREIEMERLTSAKGIPLIKGEYELEEWFLKAKGLEQEPEKGKRCIQCFILRLEKTAQLAQKLDVAWFSTTLTVSPHKDATQINKIGKELALKYGLKFLSADFKKQDGFKKSVELSKQWGFYRQNYCGCIYSKFTYKKNDS